MGPSEAGQEPRQILGAQVLTVYQVQASWEGQYLVEPEWARVSAVNLQLDSTATRC